MYFASETKANVFFDWSFYLEAFVSLILFVLLVINLIKNLQNKIQFEQFLSQLNIEQCSNQLNIEQGSTRLISIERVSSESDFEKEPIELIDNLPN